VRDAPAVGDELPADRLSIHHASILVLLLVSPYGNRRKHETKQSEREQYPSFH
jgi:hypothetical protein